jgi:hypothetical protein
VVLASESCPWLSDGELESEDGAFSTGVVGFGVSGDSAAGFGCFMNCIKSEKDRSGSLPCCIASVIGFSG